MTHSGDLLDSLQLDDEDESQAPTPEAAPESDAPSPDETGTTPDADPPEPEPTHTEGQAPAPVVPTWTPTGEPFRFKVDATEVAPEGALVTEHGILMPQAAWDGIRSQYLGNRDVWRRTQEHYQSQLRSRDEAITKATQEAQVAQSFLRNLIEEAQSNPDAFVGRLDTIISSLPVRVAEEKARLLEAREQARYAEQAQHEAAQVQEQLEGSLQNHLATQVEQALATDYKHLAGTREDAVELLRELYDKHGLELFEGVDVHDAALAASQGWQMLTQVGDRLIGWYPDRFRSQLDRRMQRVKVQQERWSQTAKVEQRNKATVTAPPVTSSPPTPKAKGPRHPTNGQFAKLDPKVRAKAARAMLDDLELDDD